MRVVVIGAGLAGLTAAYFLRQQGADVAVLERATGPGLETSYANGALLHPSLSEPWNSPGVLGFVLRNLGRDDAPMLLRPHAIPSLLNWGMQFVRQSAPARFRANALSNLRLALHSMRVLHALRSRLGLAYSAYGGGSLQVFRESHAMQAALDWSRALVSHGRQFQALSVDTLVGMEPALLPVRGALVGGIHFPMDEGGDPHQFCVSLERALRNIQVQLTYGCAATRLLTQRRSVTGVLDDTGRDWQADAVLLAAASCSRELAATAGVELPVRPVKGYSITIPRGLAETAPNLPVVDADLHMAVVPLGADRLRVAGTAEFAGYNLQIDPRRIDNLVGLVRRVYPKIADALRPADIIPWAGLRAMCPDGVPLLGATSAPGLFVNTGHGHLGWTLAAGSGQLAAAQIFGGELDIDAEAYNPGRFL